MVSATVTRYLRSYRNRFRSANSSRDTIALLLSLGFVFGLYLSSHSVIQLLSDQEQLTTLILEKIITISFLVFFVMLFFSNTVSCFSIFFNSRDMELLLRCPLPPWKIFLSRISEVLIQSSWMLFFFCIPVFLALTTSLDLPITFPFVMTGLSFFFALIPAAASCCLILLLVALVPASRLKEIATVGLLVLGLAFLSYYQSRNPNEVLDTKELFHAVRFQLFAKSTAQSWMPSTWLSSVAIAYIDGGKFPLLEVTMLLTTAFGLLSASYLVFDLFFSRGFTLASHSSGPYAIKRSVRRQKILRTLLPFPPHFWAMLSKESKMFIRDTTQSIQMILLLLLTFIYVYNFRTLRAISSLSEQGGTWWQALLSICNIALGGCVLAAIATRFVYPSISLEGNAYSALRATPLSIRRFLHYKFFIWYIPLTILAALLFASGEFAIFAPPLAIIWSVVLGAILAFGIVGLAVGFGGIYVRFDWDSPQQITTNFGSLVFMAASLFFVFFSLLPATILMVVACVPSYREMLSTTEVYVLNGSALFLTAFVSYSVMRRSLRAGEDALKNLEL